MEAINYFGKKIFIIHVLQSSKYSPEQAISITCLIIKLPAQQYTWLVSWNHALKYSPYYRMLLVLVLIFFHVWWHILSMARVNTFILKGESIQTKLCPLDSFLPLLVAYILLSLL